MGFDLFLNSITDKWSPKTKKLMVLAIEQINKLIEQNGDYGIRHTVHSLNFCKVTSSMKRGNFYEEFELIFFDITRSLVVPSY